MSVSVSTSSLSGASYVVPPVSLPAAPYANWAHKHWVWNHNGENTQDNAFALVNGYLDHSIPVGNVNIDSMWETQFNNFEVDPTRFSDFQGMIESFHAKGIKVTAWATSMVNVENPDYEMCVEKQYLVRDGFGVVRPLGWWHGSGALLDYSNPEAVSWWHSKMDNVLKMGLDGFKTDGSDPYISEYILLSGSALGYNNVSLTYRDYANYYYRDFFYYTREYRGDSGLIMARPVDCQLDRTAHLCTPFAPYDTMVSGWVGDDDSTFNGLRGAMRKIIYSAWDNYANMGSDIGGYRSEDVDNKIVFLRWAQYGAFVPLMENGGGGEHRPWMYDDETVEIYRNFVTQHYRLIPYFHTLGSNSLDSKGGVGVLKPIAKKPDVPPSRNTQPSTFSYMIGDDVIVHPVIEDNSSDGTSVVLMEFPLENQQWVSWWEPANERKVITVDASVEKSNSMLTMVPLDSYPVYARRGAYIPLGKSNEDQSPLFTWYCPEFGNYATTQIRETIDMGTGYESKIELTADGILTSTISAHDGGAGWVIYGIKPVRRIDFNPSQQCTHTYDFTQRALSIYCADGSLGLEMQINGVEPSF